MKNNNHNFRVANDLTTMMERKIKFFFVLIANKTNITAIKKLTTLKKGDFISVYENNYMKQYLSKQLNERINKEIFKIIENNQKLVERWYKRGKKYNKKVDEIIEKNKFTKINIKGVLSIIEKNFYYNTTLSRWVLSAISNSKKSNLKKYQKAIMLFQELKSVSKYPIISDRVLPRIYNLASNRVAKGLVEFLEPDELIRVINKKKVDISNINKRKKFCIVVYTANGFRYSYDRSIMKAIEEEVPKTSKIKGNIAYKGKVTGLVKIVNSSEDMKGFRKGNILLSLNTNPSLMSVMIKSAAIVTDEGGLMCHAAIVARELKKPCVIGTKIATRVFKDGDYVEVDANNGVVRKIK